MVVQVIAKMLVTMYKSHIHAGTFHVGTHPVDVIVGASVGAVVVVLIITVTIVSVIIMRRKIGMRDYLSMGICQTLYCM